jgi:hypothetical protein
MVNKITRLASKDIKEKLVNFIPHGICVYSKVKTMDDLIFTVE